MPYPDSNKPIHSPGIDTKIPIRSFFFPITLPLDTSFHCNYTPQIFYTFRCNVTHVSVENFKDDINKRAENKESGGPDNTKRLHFRAPWPTAAIATDVRGRSRMIVPSKMSIESKLFYQRPDLRRVYTCKLSVCPCTRVCARACGPCRLEREQHPCKM